MTVDKLTRLVGLHCRIYRINVLKMTLEDVAGGESIKTLSAFEHGKSTNMKHLFKYIYSCDDRNVRIEFLTTIVDLLERIEKHVK